MSLFSYLPFNKNQTLVKIKSACSTCPAFASFPRCLKWLPLDSGSVTEGFDTIKISTIAGLCLYKDLGWWLLSYTHFLTYLVDYHLSAPEVEGYTSDSLKVHPAPHCKCSSCKRQLQLFFTRETYQHEQQYWPNIGLFLSWGKLWYRKAFFSKLKKGLLTR